MKHLLSFVSACLVCLGVVCNGLTIIASDTEKKNAGEKEFDVYLLIGQSNMAGRGTMAEGDTLPFHDKVYLLNADGKPELATNPLNRYSTIRKSISLQQIGPGFSFSKKIADATGRKILLVVNAKGGSKIEEWVKGGKFYNDAVSRTRQALEYGNMKAILWHQGESDSASPDGYCGKLKAIMNGLRKDLRSPAVPVIAGEIAPWHENHIKFNAEIHRIGKYIRHSDYVTTEGCAWLKGSSDPHFSRDGQVVLGERYADKVLEMCDLSMISNVRSRMEHVLYMVHNNPGEKPHVIKCGYPEFAPEGGSYTFPVSSAMRLECDADWVRIGKNKGDSVIVKVKANNTGMTFDETRIDPAYPQMQEWIKAGRTGGIPSLEEQLGRISRTFEAGTSIKDINSYLNSSDKDAERVIYLKNGEYQLNEALKLYPNDVLIGESKDGVILYMSEDGCINMCSGDNNGVRNLTMIGAYKEETPDPTDMSEVLPGKGKLKSIDMTADTHDCYVDNVVIINSASHPIWMAGHNNTIRDVEIDGAYNKGGGAQGYFFIDGNHQLVTGCKVTRIRHITMQNPSSKYNVFYKNDVRQEFSFHVNDGGDNLIAHNRITLPEFMSTGYCSFMGPWSYKHSVGGKNFIYCNRCCEENHGGKTPWSDNEVYLGPYESCAKDKYNNFRITEGYDKPSGRTFYPVVLK